MSGASASPRATRYFPRNSAWSSPLRIKPCSHEETAAPSNSRALAGFSTSKGTIRFQPDKPIPDPLLRRIIADCVVRTSVRKRK